MTMPANFHIADAVNTVIKQFYPEDYCSLCHVHAVVGANVISVARQRNYRPVAGMAVIDCGGGEFIKLTDNTAFSRPIGGAYHCWIESTDDADEERELVDLTFSNNIKYAEKNNIRWRKKNTPAFLWGLREAIVIEGNLESLPTKFANGKVWLRETAEGSDWMARHMNENLNAYVMLTTASLKLLKRHARDVDLIV